MEALITCRMCGKGFLTLKTHIRISHNLTPKEYRKRFRLPRSFPLVSEAYAHARRRRAERMGLAANIAEARKSK